MNTLQYFYDRINGNLSDINSQAEILNSACEKANVDNLNEICNLKFTYDKLVFLQREFPMLYIDEAIHDIRVLDYYYHLINFLRQICMEQGIREGHEIFYSWYDQDDHYDTFEYTDRLFGFIRSSNVMNHWFFAYLCCCKDFACLQYRKINDHSNCSSMNDSPQEITNNVVNYLIEEIRQYLETISEKRSRGSITSVNLPIQQPIELPFVDNYYHCEIPVITRASKREPTLRQSQMKPLIRVNQQKEENQAIPVEISNRRGSARASMRTSTSRTN